jgi:hypothetical protein
MTTSMGERRLFHPKTKVPAHNSTPWCLVHDQNVAAMSHGLEAVRAEVGSEEETGVPDSALRDALWEYYFDIGLTIDWFYGMQAAFLR